MKAQIISRHLELNSILNIETLSLDQSPTELQKQYNYNLSELIMFGVKMILMGFLNFKIFLNKEY